jgi:hypothetical protein
MEEREGWRGQEKERTAERMKVKNRFNYAM